MYQTSLLLVLTGPVGFMFDKLISSQNKFHAVMTTDRPDKMKNICLEAFVETKYNQTYLYVLTNCQVSWQVPKHDEHKY
jgi:hypothetical protein